MATSRKFGDPALFGEVWADDYDDRTTLDPAPAVDFLAGLAGGGRVLELAVGTGRVALPLAARGIRVEGVEGSAKMAARLRGKPGGDGVPVTVGDMAEIPVDGPFTLVYLVYNTIFNLLEAERQQACFDNAARVLGADGAFVIEAYVPDPAFFDRGQRVHALSVTEDSATIEVYRFDPAAQRFHSQKITFDADGVHLRPHAERYCPPAELDLMADRAGLRLERRIADWSGEPFGPDSTGHVSVYRCAR
ncbi:class I SAM-dependent methyltransferase [Streptomyces sp. NBC_01478]|uniref:class I SAM-dependent DNA methyltransferase n=1 Tax=Streptomyces sp. NBC_01478 TaxID=2903882 RepID=UPI002E30A215|nr:class I SAM-dependent methyltransferase [Streptomyces sp. NBC_01478]